MRPIVQSRVGESGTCFRSALASVLEIPESQVPDFPEANCDPGVDEFLKPRGLRYEEYPITDPAPSGYHFILGTSPRGGQHCVVGLNGQYKWDPHPQDGTGRGLVEPKSWGVLEPVGGAKDSKAAELLRIKHDEIVSNHLRGAGNSAETAYNALYRPTASLVHDAEVLLSKTRLDDDPAYWHRKVESAQDHLDEAVRHAKTGKFGVATSYLDAALTLAHAVIDKMRSSGRTKGKDMTQWKPSSAVTEWKRIMASKTKYGELLRKADEDIRRTGKVTAATEVALAKAKRIYEGREAQDSTLSRRKLDRWSMREILDTLGITIQEYLRRTEEQKDRLLRTAIDKMRNSGRTKGRDEMQKPAEQLTRKEIKREINKLFEIPQQRWDQDDALRFRDLIEAQPYAKDQDSPTARRARLHRALDRVLDSARVDDRRGLPYDHPRIIAIEKKIRALEDKGVPYDDPRVQKFEAEIRRLEGI